MRRIVGLNGPEIFSERSSVVQEQGVEEQATGDVGNAVLANAQHRNKNRAGNDRLEKEISNCFSAEKNLFIWREVVIFDGQIDGLLASVRTAQHRV